MRFFLSTLFLFSTFNVTWAAPCVTPQVASDCCNYQIQDQQAGKNPWYKGPKAYFANESDAQVFAASMTPKMPMYEPFEADVTLVAGWHYSSGSHHSGLDWWKTTVSSGNDVTFKVNAIAPGRVVSQFWDNWFGNLVIIEHVAPTGQKYRSLYMHLRNGFTHDLNAARAIVPQDPNGTNNTAKYKKFAMKSNPNPLYWGTEAHKINVKVGDWVVAGQFLGWAGNTGAGGAGNGLANDGTPTDSVRANNHLHFMLTVPVPGQLERWVFLDAFGVYEKAQSGCYELQKETKFARFFAPFYPSFHNLDLGILTQYFGYWPSMGLGLQTLSTHYTGNKLLASGSFQSEVAPQWVARAHMPADQLSTWVTTYHDQGLRPRELSMTLSPTGRPFFNVIWKKRAAGEGVYIFVNMTDAEFSAKWNDLVVSKGYRLEDYVSYEMDRVKYQGAIFVLNSDKGFLFWKNMTAGEFQQKFNEMDAKGWRMVNMNISNASDGRIFAGIWRSVAGQWAAYAELSAAQYQEQFSDFSANGLRPYKLQGYGSPARFGVIWTK